MYLSTNSYFVCISHSKGIIHLIINLGTKFVKTTIKTSISQDVRVRVLKPTFFLHTFKLYTLGKVKLIDPNALVDGRVVFLFETKICQKYFGLRKRLYKVFGDYYKVGQGGLPTMY